jgi:ABC-type multidrug transport system ATPase subunit
MYAHTARMIEFQQVTRSFGGGRIRDRAPRTIVALNGVSLTIPRGTVHAVVGPNGAGKSTLLALLLGFLRPTSGEVLIEDDEPKAYLRRKGAGYLPERFGLPPRWPVRSALRALARLDGAARHADRRADDALARFGLEPHATKQLSTLSRGLLQRVGLAQAFLSDRALLVLDEPTEGLDPLWRIRFRTAVAAARERGTTIVLASHDLGEIERLADSATLLEDGKVREVLDTRPPRDPREYTIRLDAPADVFPEIFPGAVSAEDPHAYRVTVESAADLSTRLAALLAAGAIVTAVEPRAEPFEDRVRRALAEDA